MVHLKIWTFCSSLHHVHMVYECPLSLGDQVNMYARSTADCKIQKLSYSIGPLLIEDRESIRFVIKTISQKIVLPQRSLKNV